MENVDGTVQGETTVQLEAAQTFATRNIINTRPGRKCVDGRYELATADSGMIARPGADLGYVEVLVALNDELDLGLTPEECFDRIYDIVTSEGGMFHMHTDHHADPEKIDEDDDVERPFFGCGHVAKATHPWTAQKYGLEPGLMAQVVDHARKRMKEGARINMTNLRGDHMELGVLKNTGTKRTVNPFNRSQYFVYDKTRDDAYIAEKIVPGLDIPEVTVEMFTEISDMQLAATLENLAKGKPIFVFNADDSVPRVKLEGVI